MASAWIFQKPEDVRDRGEDKAPWYCGWYEPDGRRRKKQLGSGLPGKKAAERHAAKLENDLMTGNYQVQVRKLWDEFVREYERRILDGLAVRTRLEALQALGHFKRLARPVKVFTINTGTIDDYIAERRKERGKKRGSSVSPATINKDLRHIKAALGLAVEWTYLARMPRFHRQREQEKLITFVTPEHFTLLYKACEQARWPADQPYPAADWWRALLVMGAMTGWRIGQLLELRREDVDLAGGFVITRAAHNKGKRDRKIELHPLAVEHLHRIASFSPVIFPWTHGVRIYGEFHRLQEKAGIKLTEGRYYGFHDLRRMFATMNAENLTPDTLQVLMQHQAYTTTQRYIDMARQVRTVADKLFVPTVTARERKAE